MSHQRRPICCINTNILKFLTLAKILGNFHGNVNVLLKVSLIGECSFIQVSRRVSERNFFEQIICICCHYFRKDDFVTATIVFFPCAQNGGSFKQTGNYVGSEKAIHEAGANYNMEVSLTRPT